MRPERKSGIELIAEERQRQIEKEGWTSNHDEVHDLFQLSAAAGCYIASAIDKGTPDGGCSDMELPFTRFQVAIKPDERKKWVDGWPWDEQCDKRGQHDVKKSLVIAGALIAAEIDRLQALELTT